ncbi:hypothetical protein QUA10_05690 [Microcoleus sp. Pol8_D6]|uniref:hypothetical protein n=2 Tax=unclassified Microcoleus TaxID=2642155 RepID=UPI002FD61753
MGSAGGIKATGKLTAGIDGLLGQQGIKIEADATNRTLGIGAEIGSTRGKLGVNIGGKIGYSPDGKISIKGAEAGINIAGTGGSASIDEDEGIKGSISVAGAKIEVAVSPDGKKSLSLCYGVPGGELCVKFEPDPGITTPTPSVTPTPTPTPTPAPTPYTPGLANAGVFTVTKSCKDDDMFLAAYHGNWNSKGELINQFIAWTLSPIEQALETYLILRRRETYNPHYYANPAGPGLYNIVPQGIYTDLTAADIKECERWSYPGGYFQNGVETIEYLNYCGNWHWQKSKNIIGHSLINSTSNTFTLGKYDAHVKYKINYKRKKYYHKDTSRGINPWYGSPYDYSIEILEIFPAPPCPGGYVPPPVVSPLLPVNLPNYPQHFTPMNDCCEQIREMYKYLGIAKLKKNKFPVSNAFLVPGGTGNDNCVDYYAITQALFRMLANGLIINPKSKPLGSEWQSTNATAWASNMYEMMAESMSDGNSTQRFEVAAIMQLVQIMSTLAETSRKVEFVADSIGIEPEPVPEELPVCFTIYEGHKGFGKAEPKKLKVSGLKTDNQVEEVLGKMLAPSKIPIVRWQFKPGQISINEALKNG